jgi:hypothetical protein
LSIFSGLAEISAGRIRILFQKLYMGQRIPGESKSGTAIFPQKPQNKLRCMYNNGTAP